MTIRRVAIVGYGAIGRSIVERLETSPLPSVKLVAVLMRTRQLQQREYALPQDALATDNLTEMMKTNPDTVIEAAGHAAVAECASSVLSNGCELFVLSIGALANAALASRLVSEAAQGHGRIVIPSGALAGFDGLLTLREAGLTAVTYRAIKPPIAWQDTPAERYCNLAELRHSLVFFSDSARKAAQRFPKSANLAVAVGLAGLGLDRTRVELVADPSVRMNIGEVVAQTQNSLLELRLANSGFESNPKTSQITGLSVIAALANRSAPIRYQ